MRHARFVLPALLVVLVPAAAWAQTITRTQTGWTCTRHASPYLIQCTGQANCDARIAEHNCSLHNECGQGGGGETTSPAKMMPFPLALGLAGFLVGDQVVYSATGNKMNTTFGWGGLSAGSVLALAVNSGKMSRGTAIGYGLLAGVSGGLAWSAYQTAKGDEARTGVNVGLGAAGGLALGAVFGFAPPSPKIAPRWLGPNAQVRVAASFRRVGVIAVW